MANHSNRISIWPSLWWRRQTWWVTFVATAACFLEEWVTWHDIWLYDSTIISCWTCLATFPASQSVPFPVLLLSLHIVFFFFLLSARDFWSLIRFAEGTRDFYFYFFNVWWVCLKEPLICWKFCNIDCVWCDVICGCGSNRDRGGLYFYYFVKISSSFNDPTSACGCSISNAFNKTLPRTIAVPSFLPCYTAKRKKLKKICRSLAVKSTCCPSLLVTGKMHVSLAEALEVRGGPLQEEEVWAVLSQSAESLQELFHKGINIENSSHGETFWLHISNLCTHTLASSRCQSHQPHYLSSSLWSIKLSAAQFLASFSNLAWVIFSCFRSPLPASFAHASQNRRGRVEIISPRQEDDRFLQKYHHVFKISRKSATAASHASKTALIPRHIFGVWLFVTGRVGGGA